MRRARPGREKHSALEQSWDRGGGLGAEGWRARGTPMSAVWDLLSKSSEEARFFSKHDGNLLRGVKAGQ